MEDLPSVSSIDYRELDKDYLTACLIRTLFSWIIIAGIFSLGILFNNSNEDFDRTVGPFIIYVIIALVIIALISFLLTYFGFFKKGYAVRDKDISYRTGIFWKSTTLIPFNRIQHSEVKQGPFERMFGLSSLRVFTAGGSASDLSINGLKKEQANHLKQFIIKKTTIDEEE